MEMMIKENYIEEFLRKFPEKDREIIEKMVYMNIIPANIMRNYILVCDLKELQFKQGKSFAESIEIQSLKHNLTTRRIRTIYNCNTKFAKINV